MYLFFSGLFGLFGLFLCIMSASKLLQKEGGKKIIAEAKESFEEIISPVKFIDNSSFAKKHNINTSSKYYRTRYSYINSFGEEQNFFDDELTDYKVPEGTKKEFYILNDNTIKKMHLNEKTQRTYIKHGLFYILLSIITLIVQIYFK